MLLLNFPQEIIVKTADFLSIEDKASCSLVCKSWKGLFQDSMHSDLAIKSRDDLRNVISSVEDYCHTYQTNGHLVRYLQVNQDLNATDEELYALQSTFQNIKYLHLEQNALNPIEFGITADWHLWRLLRELHVSLGDSRIPDAENAFLEIILCLPLLSRLEIVRRPTEPTRITFSLKDLETIHSHLTHLVHLKLSSDLLTLSDADLERITKVSPTPKMDSFSINSKTTDHRWLCYFARKYPNIRTLEFSTSNHQAEIEEQRTDAIELFHKIPLAFQHLQKLHIEYLDCPLRECLFFWDMIQPHTISLRHVTIYLRVPKTSVYPSEKPKDIPKQITTLYLTKFAGTMESFSLTNGVNTCAPIDLADIGANLYNLVELKIGISTAPIELDTLFKAAPRLESVSLNKAQIKVKDELYHSKRFKLQEFEIEASKITSDALRFLSFHCRNLKALNVTHTVVSGNFSKPGCQFIDMTYTRLKTLVVKNTAFIINDSKESPDNLNMALITRPIDDIPPKQDYDPNVLPIIIGGTPIKSHYHWFYKKKSSIMTGMSKARGSRIEKFFSNYEENKIITIDRAVCPQKRKPHVNWKNNCVFGYTKIKFGYVADCNIVTS